MMNLRFGTMLVLLGGMLVSTTPADAQLASSFGCASAKLKSLGKTASSVFGCYSKLAKVGGGVGAIETAAPGCVQKAEDKWDLAPVGAFQKAETKAALVPPGCALEGQNIVLEGRCAITTTKTCGSDFDCVVGTDGHCTVHNDDTESMALYDLVNDEHTTTTHGFPNGLAEEVIPLLIPSSSANACQAAKLKATGKLAAALLGCHSKAAKSNLVVDQACIGKAVTKHTQAYQKAELKPPCDTTGDVDTIKSKIDPFVEKAVAGIPRQDGCGSGTVLPPETCDDGNTINEDSCPSDCIVDTCTPNADDVPFTVSFTSAKPVGSVTVFVDYPEGKLNLPGSGGSAPSGTYDFDNFSEQEAFNDFDHGVKAAVVTTGTDLGTTGDLFTAHFNTCSGAPAATAGDFTCEVLDAADAAGKALKGVTCSVN